MARRMPLRAQGHQQQRRSRAPRCGVRAIIGQAARSRHDGRGYRRSPALVPPLCPPRACRPGAAKAGMPGGDPASQFATSGLVLLPSLGACPVLACPVLSPGTSPGTAATAARCRRFLSRAFLRANSLACSCSRVVCVSLKSAISQLSATCTHRPASANWSAQRGSARRSSRSSSDRTPSVRFRYRPDEPCHEQAERVITEAGQPPVVKPSLGEPGTSHLLAPTLPPPCASSGAPPFCPRAAFCRVR